MGNGESTSRQIAMQRSEEGTIQISEDVMLRLRGEELKPKHSVELDEGQAVIHEEDLKNMVESAFLQGRKIEFEKYQNEKEKLMEDADLLKEEQAKFEQIKEDLQHKLDEKITESNTKDEYLSQLELKTGVELKDGQAIVSEDELQQIVENAFFKGCKDEFDRQQTEKDQLLNQINFGADLLKQKREECELIRKGLEEKLLEKERYEKEVGELHEMSAEERMKYEENINEINEFLSEEQHKHAAELLEMNQLLLQEKQKQDEKDREMNENVAKLSQENEILQNKVTLKEKEICKEFEKSVHDIRQRIKPLESSTICADSQSKVLDCYRANKKQPLKCANEVQSFIDCVQTTRLKFMQKHLIDGK